MECRSGDGATLALLSALSHRATALACAAERAFMRRLEGGCSAPVAAHAEVVAAQGEGEIIRIDGGVWSLDGKDTRWDEKDAKRCTNQFPVKQTLLPGKCVPCLIFFLSVSILRNV